MCYLQAELCSSHSVVSFVILSLIRCVPVEVIDIFSLPQTFIMKDKSHRPLDNTRSYVDEDKKFCKSMLFTASQSKSIFKSLSEMLTSLFSGYFSLGSKNQLEFMTISMLRSEKTSESTLQCLMMDIKIKQLKPTQEGFPQHFCVHTHGPEIFKIMQTYSRTSSSNN